MIIFFIACLIYIVQQNQGVYIINVGHDLLNAQTSLQVVDPLNIFKDGSTGPQVTPVTRQLTARVK